MAIVGSRISLLSKTGIRYVGVLAHLDEEQSSLTLDNVRSFGTEGRKGGGPDEIGAVDTVYEMIMFKGADISDITYLDYDQPSQAPGSQSEPAIQTGTASKSPVGPPTSTAPGFPPLGGFGGPQQRIPQQQPYGVSVRSILEGPGLGPQQSFMNPYVMAQLAQQNPALWAQLQQQLQSMGMPGNGMPQQLPSSQPPGTAFDQPNQTPISPPVSGAPSAVPQLTSPIDDAASRLKALKVSDAAKPAPSPIGTPPVTSTGGFSQQAPGTKKPDTKTASQAPSTTAPAVTSSVSAAVATPEPIAVVVKKEPKASRAAGVVGPKVQPPQQPQAGAAPQQGRTAQQGQSGIQQAKRLGAAPGSADGHVNGDSEVKKATTLADVVQGKKVGANETIVVPPIPDSNTRSRGNFGGPTGIPYRGGAFHRGRGGARGPPVPQDDYDFDEANRKFEEISKAIVPPVTSTPASASVGRAASASPALEESEDGEIDLDVEKAKGSGFYDKSGFFDDISCEAKDRQVEAST
ncbi:hypothetical protein HDU93_001111 [Gonapodya sp. JEL0774]|nr:hypothetical protein HDU93_001111 [Gonapodya sp. JEL0774]